MNNIKTIIQNFNKNPSTGKAKNIIKILKLNPILNNYVYNNIKVV